MLRCTKCGEVFERFGKEFELCPECKVGFLIGGSFAKTGQSALYQEMTQHDPQDPIDEFDCNGDCESCLEEPEDPYATDCKNPNASCQCNASRPEIEGCPKFIKKDSECYWVTNDFNESLSAVDVSEQEFILTTLDREEDENPETAILDGLDIFIDTFRDRDDEGNITDNFYEYD